MENVLTAVIIIFIILFAILTLSYAFIDSQSNLFDTWRDMEQQRDIAENTHLAVTDVYTQNNGQEVLLTVQNTGSTRLIDFSMWDVILTYFDTNIPPAYHVRYLIYEGASGDTWEIASINHLYVGRDASDNEEEILEPGVLNPGEQMTLLLELSVGIGNGQAAQVTIATRYASTASTVFSGNHPPELSANTGINMPVNSTITLNTDLLSAVDPDDRAYAGPITYTIETSPSAGTITPGDTFTQTELEAGLVTYQHTGPLNDDSFMITLSDGQDTSSPETITITTTQAPVLSANSGLVLSPGATAAINTGMMSVIDADSDPADLIYTITAPTTRGLLSLGTSFSQADIEAGLLTYTHGGSGADSFQFTVSDGSCEIGPFMFTINPM